MGFCSGYRAVLRCLPPVIALAVGLTPARDASAADPPFRKLTGKHITLHTDVPSSSEVDILPQVFDLAFPEWCKYFSVDPVKHANWHVTASLMRSRDRFEAAGLASPDLPDFKNGYSRGDQFWLYDQSSDYYRRHLLLHEGTHSFMDTIVGGSGPPWYCEGMAELIATHRWQDGKLTLNYSPRSADEVLRLGRVEIVQNAVANGNPLSLGQVLGFDNRAHLQNEPYGWCFALAAFLDGHPRYQQRFRALPKVVAANDFPQRFRQLFQADGALLADEWRMYVQDIEYGYDFSRVQLQIAPGQPVPREGASVAVAADRSWQPSGIRLEAGKSYQISASGRYQVANQGGPWWCEPNGVTLRYYHGQPLGVLLATVRSDQYDPANPAWSNPQVVGLAGQLSPRVSGTLYLRINDSAAELADNSGSLNVKVVAQ